MDDVRAGDGPEGRPETKMWLAVRRDLGLSAYKLAAQSGHAFGRLYLAAARDAPEAFEAYLADDEPKIVVYVKGEAALLRVEREACGRGIPARLIRDAGRSEIPPDTATVCAFGPCTREALPRYLGSLQVARERFREDAEAAGAVPPSG